MKSLTMKPPLAIPALIVDAGQHRGDSGIMRHLTASGFNRCAGANAQKRLLRLAGTLAKRGARPHNETDLEQHAWI